METADRQTFIQNYGKLIVRTWAEPDYLESLENNPVPAIREEGLPIPDDAQVRVMVLEPTGKGEVDDQIEAWEKGELTGKYDLFIPKRPETMPSGAMAAGGTYCCCPCCCCT